MVVFFLIVLGSLSFVSGTSAEPIDVFANSLSLDTGTQLDGPNGTLIYRGGFELTSPDARFGGLSGLVISSDGAELVAVSDRGWWLQARLGYDLNGDLVSINVGELTPMLSVDAQYNEGSVRLDAEALVRLPNGDFVVAFERPHRLWQYSGTNAVARSLRVASILKGLPHNRGIEALAMLDGERLIAIAESGPSASAMSGWVFGVTQSEPFSYPYDGYFRPSDAVRMDDRRVLVLERGYTERRGVAGRLMLLDVVTITAGARLQPRQFVELGPPIPLDNFEALAVRHGPCGALLVYLLSDDNYSPRQRTLLLMFEFVEME